MKQKLLMALYNDFNNQRIINSNNLRTILYDNRDTDFGRKYDFLKIYNSDHLIEDFRLKVPLSCYKDYVENGFSCVYAKYFDVSSAGSTGWQKVLPITTEALKRYSPYIYLEPFYIGKVERNNLLHVSLFQKSGDKISFPTAHYRFMKDSGILRCSNFIGGESCLFSDKKVNVPYLKLWLALSNENLAAIMSVYLHDVLLMMCYLEKNWQQLLYDMENFVISENIPPEMEIVLLSLAKEMSEERFLLLHREFEKGFEEPVMKRIWPRLKMISGIGGILFSAYEKALNRYAGDIPINYFSYGQGECISGIATKMNNSSYTLLPRSAFFEFIDIVNGKIYLSDMLVPGKKYQLVVTTFSGLYRYKTGDIISITGFTGQSPNFLVFDKLHHSLNIGGENINEFILGLAVERLIVLFKLKLKTYYVGVDRFTIPCRYILFLDVQNNINNNDFIVQEIERAFDRILKDICWDYMDLRCIHIIGKPVCKIFNGFDITEKMEMSHCCILPDLKIQQLLKYMNGKVRK